jgi:PAS domain S-box-containing protein
MPAVPIAERVLEAMADAVVAGDNHGRITLWNSGAERMFGWRAAEVLGAEFPGVADATAVREHVEALARVRADEHVSLATKRRRMDGTLLDVWIVFSPVRAWVDGPVDGWLAVIRDATRERAVQRELRSRVELVSRLASVVASVNSDLDLATVLRRISESGRELLAADGAAYAVIDGDDLVVTALSGLPAKLAGARIPVAESAVADLRESGRTSISASNRDYPNSSPLVAEHTRHLPWVAVAVTRLDGELSGALYVFFAAERHAVGQAELGVLELLADSAGTAIANARAYDRLRRLREHERAVIDATADGMAVLDGAGLVRHWNPAAQQLTGIEEAAALGRPLPFPEGEPGVVLEHQLESGVWLEILCSRIAGSAETVVDFRDITRAKAIEASKDLFLAVTSHELRTPITVVQGYASTLLTHWDDLTDEERRESVDRIADRTRALAALVEQLLLGSRAGSAAPHVAVEFDLAGVLRTAVAGFMTVTDSHTFVLDVPPDLPDVVGDPSSVEVVFGQLLENAVKYSPGGGEVSVSAHVVDDTVVVEVADRGIGIPDGEHENVFDRFYQVGGERRRFGGVGLGLYIVRKLLDAQGAGSGTQDTPASTVRARPREGGGTCFEVVLPTAR